MPDLGQPTPCGGFCARPGQTSKRTFAPAYHWRQDLAGNSRSGISVRTQRDLAVPDIDFATCARKPLLSRFAVRIVVLFIGLVIAVIGAAFAQENPTANGPFLPAFEARSTHSLSSRQYPEGALRRGVTGIVHLCCRARTDRTLACEVGVEWPRGHDFANASLRLIGDMRLTADSFAQLHARPTTTFRVPVRWQISPVPPALDDAQRQIDSSTVDLCGPNTGRALPSSYIVVTTSPVG